MWMHLAMIAFAALVITPSAAQLPVSDPGQHMIRQPCDIGSVLAPSEALS
jgi:hypothetical protein